TDRGDVPRRPAGPHSGLLPVGRGPDRAPVSPLPPPAGGAGAGALPRGGRRAHRGAGRGPAALRAARGDRRRSADGGGRRLSAARAKEWRVGRLSRRFFSRPSEVVARALLGKRLVCGGRAGVIVETEAYVGPHDLAC